MAAKPGMTRPGMVAFVERALPSVLGESHGKSLVLVDNMRRYIEFTFLLYSDGIDMSSPVHLSPPIVQFILVLFRCIGSVSGRSAISSGRAYAELLKDVWGGIRPNALKFGSSDYRWKTRLIDVWERARAAVGRRRKKVRKKVTKKRRRAASEMADEDEPPSKRTRR
jgi:hypothetical protein